MKYSLFVSVLFAGGFLMASNLKAKDFYVAQTAQGAANGQDAADAYAITFFNSSGNWGAGAGQISPGDTVHLVGTITGQLSFQSSGSPGKPITLYFEPGANITMPAIPANDAIQLGSYNYLVIDGGVNGTIQSTANGTGLANDVSSMCIEGSPSIGNITIGDLLMTNIYVRTSVGGANSDTSGGGSGGVYLHSAATNIVIYNNKIYSVAAGVQYVYNPGYSANILFYSNIVVHCNWGLRIGSGNANATIANVVEHHNVINEFASWDDPADAFHHDGIFLSSDHAGAWASNYWIYDNQIGPIVGQHVTGQMYFSGQAGIVKSGFIYNNILTRTDSSAGDGHVFFWWCSGAIFANNTLWSASGVSPIGIRISASTNIVVTNNIVFDPPSTTCLLIDNGAIGTVQDYNCFYGSSPSGSYTGGSHNVTSDPLFVNAAGTNFMLQATSPAIGAGVNMSSYFTYDVNGNTRPGSGAWDLGAYEYALGSIQEPIINNVQSSPATSSAAISWTTDQNASSIVNYGLTATYGMSITNPSLATTHQITLPNLAANTLYHFQVRSIDSTNSGNSSSDYTFTTISTNLPPIVSAITQTGADVDPVAPGLQIFAGSVVQYSGTASDPNGFPLTWNWLYTINGGPEILLQSGTGTVSSVSYNYTANTVGDTYVWKLRVSDGYATNESDLTVGVEMPAPTNGVVFSATSGTINSLFVVTNGYIYQPVQTGVTNGGTAIYNFTITNAANYVIQALVNAPNDAANSLYINIDAMPQDPTMIWDIPLTSGFEQRIVSWRGNGTDTSNQFVPEYFNLSQGIHQLIIVGREANVQIQSLAILQAPFPPLNLRIIAP